MEYSIIVRNSFAELDIINQLAGRGSLISVFKDPWIGNRTYVSGDFDPHFSPGLLARMGRHLHSKPVYETRDFTVYEVSSKGSLTMDYYHLSKNRTLIYNRLMKFASWEQISASPYNDSDILDSPLGHAVINSPFGKIRGGRPHGGTDYLAGRGTPYHATARGTVVRADLSATFGNVVILDHGPGYQGGPHVYTIYAHASKLLVQRGQIVSTGDVVSLVGNTGRVVPKPPDGNHGHYEVIQTNDIIGSTAFYSFNNKHRPTDLRRLLKGF